MKNLIIVGAGGHGKVLADIALKMKKWDKVMFIDDIVQKKTIMDLDVIGNIDNAILYKNKADFVVGIGDNCNREKIQCILEKKGLSIASVIHPSAVIGADVKIKRGTVVMAGAIINSSSEIGKGCIINTNCNIDHDNILDDFIHISPGVNLAGTIKIGKKSWVGIGSTVKNNVNICEDVVIGAGAVVVNDIIKSGTYIGVPAKRYK